MKKLILTLFTVIAFINVQAQCNSNPISNNGASGTLYFSDSSTVSPNFSTNYSVSYFWNFGDGTTSTQQSPCHTYGDLSNVTFPLYATLSVTYLDSTTFNFCQDIDSVGVTIFINPCVYGDLQIAASGNNLTANWTYNIGGTSGCGNNYADTYLWSNGDTNQTATVTSAGTYTCTVTTTTGCVYATSYTYNGSLNLTFDCSQMDIFEANNDYNVVSFQSDYLNNNNLFPELIDSLSFWDVFDAGGFNIGLYPMIWQGAPSTLSVQNVSSSTGLPSDSLYVCYNAYLYDSLYQHNLWVNPQLGSVCSSCEWLVWNGSSPNTPGMWVSSSSPPPTPTFVCDPIFGCFDPGTGTGLYSSLAQCQAVCSSSWSNVFCDSLNVSVIASTVDSITLGTNLSSLGYTGPALYTWTEFTLSGITGNTSTSGTPSFAIAIGDTNIYLLELTIIDNSGMSWICLYPTLVYFDGGSWIALRTSQPGATGIDNLGQAISNRKLLKIVDIMGRETEFKKNEVLFYMYDDGSTEKKFFK
tara:strand:+ start:1783 stop:3357 length:1575 start_codon:yes stop_codon:yes gene_type:complete